MSQEDETKLIDVDEGNVPETGFFCFMSKRQTELAEGAVCRGFEDKDS